MCSLSWVTVTLLRGDWLCRLPQKRLQLQRRPQLQERLTRRPALSTRTMKWLLLWTPRLTPVLSLGVSVASRPLWCAFATWKLPELA